MNLLFSAASGWGKSFYAQATIEQNLDEYDHVLVLDYKDEYRGLVKAGMAKHYIIGPNELQLFGRAEWTELLERNPHLVAAKLDWLNDEDWRAAVAAMLRVARTLGRSMLVVVDEAHFIAPQKSGYPTEVQHLATTGRGERFSAMWITQRLAQLDEDVIGNSTARELGGFESDADLKKLRPVLEYPVEAHRSGGRSIPDLPEQLHAVDAGAVSVRKFTEGDDLVGSEWIYSDDSGQLERTDTRDLADRMGSTHYGHQGKPIHRP